MALIYAKAGLPEPIITERIIEAWESLQYIRWGASLLPSCVKVNELDTFRERYKIPDTIEMFVPTHDERACYPRERCSETSEAILSGGMNYLCTPSLDIFLGIKTYPLPN